MNENRTQGSYESFDLCVRISAPISITLHPSGEMDVIFPSATKSDAPQAKESIRFNPQAASQFLDAIYAAVQNGHITFEEKQELLH